MSKNCPVHPIVLSEEELTIFSDHSRTIPKPKKKRKRSKIVKKKSDASKKKTKARKQIQAKKFLLTFPQCELDPQLVLTRLIFKYPCKWAIVSQEKHLDGNNHLHLVFWLKEKVVYRNFDFWDFLTGKHGNYKVVTSSILKVVKYVIKDKNYVCHGIEPLTWITSHQTKKGASFELAAQLLKEGKSMEELDDMHPGMVARNLAKLQKYQSFLKSCKRKKAAKELEKWKPIDISSLDLDFRTLGLWINNNLAGIPRPFKMKQLWLWGCSNLGKTSLVMNLMKWFRIYMIPMDVRHLDDYEDSDYDLLVMDEFKGQKSITWMNGFTQGSPFPIHRRYHCTMKTKNLPIIVLSNYSIEQAYEKVNMFNPERLNSIKNRFEVINVNKFIDLKF